MSDLGKTITDLEAKATLLEAENESLRHTSALQSQQLSDGEKKIAKLEEDRDHYMRQNAELRTLLEMAGTCIVDGMKKIHANHSRAGVMRGLQQAAASEDYWRRKPLPEALRPDPNMVDSTEPQIDPKQETAP